MRISDWSSDVCSSDLPSTVDGGRTAGSGTGQRPDAGRVAGMDRLPDAAAARQEEASTITGKPVAGGGPDVAVDDGKPERVSALKGSAVQGRPTRITTRKGVV